MIDLTGIPMPDDAPEPGACIRVERPEDGVVRIVLDPPHRKLTVLDTALLRDLDAVIDELQRDTSIRGVVLTGRDPSQFAVGADVKAIESITDPALLKRMVVDVHGLFRRIETWSAKTVAAIGGPVPGGALELSLCCDMIVASDASSTKIGLPETQLGIIPAWGGTHRLPRRVGVPAAMTAILTGRLYPAKLALRLGMIDRLTKPEYLERVALDLASGRAKNPRKGRGSQAWLVDKNPLIAKFAAKKAREGVMAKTRGHYPAPLRVIDMVAAAPRTPPSSGRLAKRSSRRSSPPAQSART